MSLIFDIKRYSINDGPGIRLTLFFKGCPLSCVWCHNPEGVSKEKEKLYNQSKCIKCLTCVHVCPNRALALKSDAIVTDTSICVTCGKCADACPTGAMEISGKEMSVDEIMKEIEKEYLFFDQSGGGVTFCGGEPLLHKELLMELLDRCGKLSIHRTVDTSLYATGELVREVASNCELILADLKHMDPVKHEKFTGVDNGPILSNIRMIAREGYKFMIRIPFIEGVNADEENITATAAFLASLQEGNRPAVEMLPYHDIAKGKHTKLGTVYNPNRIKMEKPSEQVTQRALQIFHERGIEAVVR